MGDKMRKAYNLFIRTNNLLEKYYGITSTIELPKIKQKFITNKERFKKLYQVISKENQEKLKGLLNNLGEVVEQLNSQPGELKFTISNIKKTKDPKRKIYDTKVYFTDNINNKTTLFIPTYEYVTNLFEGPNSLESLCEGDDYNKISNERIVQSWKRRDFVEYAPSSNDMVPGEPLFGPNKIWLYSPEFYLSNEGYSMFIINESLFKDEIKDFKRWLKSLPERKDLPIKSDIKDVFEMGVEKLNKQIEKETVFVR